MVMAVVGDRASHTTNLQRRNMLQFRSKLPKDSAIYGLISRVAPAHSRSPRRCPNSHSIRYPRTRKSRKGRLLRQGLKLLREIKKRRRINLKEKGYSRN